MATAPIRKSSENINARYQFNANGLSMALERAFGFAPRILSPYGGARTKQQCIDQGTSWRLSDHYEDSPNAALDIDNQSTYRAIDEDLFLRICAQFHWYNVQIGGKPFPKGVERWHFRCITPMAAPADWAGTLNPAPINDHPQKVEIMSCRNIIRVPGGNVIEGVPKVSDFIENGNGEWAFFHDTTVGNRTALQTGFSTPDVLQAAVVPNEPGRIADTLNGQGVPDMGTLIRNAGKWYAKAPRVIAE